jgi:hypothetical protein
MMKHSRATEKELMQELLAADGKARDAGRLQEENNYLRLEIDRCQNRVQQLESKVFQVICLRDCNSEDALKSHDVYANHGMRRKSG